MKMKAVDQKDCSYLRGLLLGERLAAKPPKKKLMKKQISSMKPYHHIFVPETLGNAKTKTTMVRAKPLQAFCDDLATKIELKSHQDSGDSGTSAVAAKIMAPPQQMMSTPPSSPKTAARVTMLKTKFAATILKAQRQLFANSAAKKEATVEQWRRAAREALENVERNVEVEDTHKSFQDLEELCGFPVPYNGGFLKTMHHYGLYLKN